MATSAASACALALVPAFPPPLDIRGGLLFNRLNAVQIDVPVPAALFLVVLDADPSVPKPPRAFPDLIAERRVLIAVRVTPDVSGIAVRRAEDADLGQRYFGLHLGMATRGRLANPGGSGWALRAGRSAGSLPGEQAVPAPFPGN